MRGHNGVNILSHVDIKVGTIIPMDFLRNDKIVIMESCPVYQGDALIPMFTYTGVASKTDGNQLHIVAHSGDIQDSAGGDAKVFAISINEDSGMISSVGSY